MLYWQSCALLCWQWSCDVDLEAKGKHLPFPSYLSSFALPVIHSVSSRASLRTLQFTFLSLTSLLPECLPNLLQDELCLYYVRDVRAHSVDPEHYVFPASQTPFFFCFSIRRLPLQKAHCLMRGSRMKRNLI